MRIDDRYEVVGGMLQGGMGRVYPCVDLGNNGRPLALKTLLPKYLRDRRGRDRFLQEATTWTRLGRHPHIVRSHGVISVGVNRDIYILLEWVNKGEGHPDASLRCVMNPAGLGLRAGLLYGIQIAWGMAHATKVVPSLVHRDLKPENILASGDEMVGWGVSRVRVTDFGLAAAMAESADEGGESPDAALVLQGGWERRTMHTAGWVGTPLYMAPEQWRGNSLGAATDIYAWGNIVHELVTGRPVMEGATVGALKQAHEGGLMTLNACALGPRLEVLLRRALAMDHAARPQSWEEVAAESGQILAEVGQLVGEAPAATTGEPSWAERADEGLSYNSIGIAYLTLGEPRTALEYLERALLIGEETGHPPLECAALGNLATSWREVGENGKAVAFAERQLAIAQRTGYLKAQGNASAMLGNVCMDRGDVRSAIPHFEETLAVARKTGDRLTEGHILGMIGTAWRKLGEPRTALEYLEQDLAISQELGDRVGEGVALGNLGNVFVELGEHGNAIDCYEKRIAIAEETADRMGEAMGSLNLAGLCAQLGQHDVARKHAKRALVLFEQIGSPRAQQARGLAEALDKVPSKRQAANPKMEKLMQQLAPQIRAAAAAVWDPRARAQVERDLARMEAAGWRVSGAIKRVWSGERDAAALTAGLDEGSRAFVKAVLGVLEMV